MTIEVGDGAASALHVWEVPAISGAPLAVAALQGTTTTFVGRNGVGKSALASWMNSVAPKEKVLRVLAHRRIWFSHAAPTLTPQQNVEYVGYIQQSSHSLNSRWNNDYEEQRTGMALYALMARLNSENQRAIAEFRAGRSVPEVDATVGAPLLDRLNAVLRKSGLVVEVRMTEDQSFAAVRTDLGVEYPVSQMSDGEKNALLLAAEILTATPGTISIIDEPERHLHRAISSALIAAIVAERPDCGFSIFTHDLELAADLSRAGGRTFLVERSNWDGARTTGWQLHEVEEGEYVPEDARLAILGGRSKILFVEGAPSSIDRRLYELLYPDWAVHPAGGNVEVRRDVAGLRDSAAHHWITAAGIVDGDGRSADEREALRAKGVVALPVAEVENLYYVEDVLAAIAAKQSATLGRPVSDLVSRAKAAGLDSLAATGTLDRLARALALGQVQRALVEHFPTEIGNDPVVVAVESPLAQRLSRLNSLLAAADYEALVDEVPIRDTAFRARVAMALGFQHFRDYEDAARICIGEQPALSDALRAKLDLAVP